MQNKVFTYDDFMGLSEYERQIIVNAISVKLNGYFIYMNDWQVVKRMNRLCYNRKLDHYTFKNTQDLIQTITDLIVSKFLPSELNKKQFSFQSKFSYWGDGFLLMLGQKKGNVRLSFDMWMG